MYYSIVIAIGGDEIILTSLKNKGEGAETKTFLKNWLYSVIISTIHIFYKLYMVILYTTPGLIVFSSTMYFIT